MSGHQSCRGVWGVRADGEKDGKPGPIDSVAVEGPKHGQLYRPDRCDHFIRVTQPMIDRGEVSEGDGPFYVSHFATCPRAQDFRRSERAAR